MKIDGRGIAVGLGVAIATLLLIGLASRGFSSADDIAEASDAVSPAADNANEEQPIQNAVKVENPADSFVEEFADAAKQTTDNHIVEDHRVSLQDKPQLIWEKVIKLDSRKYRSETSISTDSYSSVDGQMETNKSTDDVDVSSYEPPQPLLPKKTKNKKHRSIFTKKSEEIRSAVDNVIEDIVELPEYKVGLLESLLRLFTGKARTAVKAKVPMVRVASVRQSNVDDSETLFG